MVKSCPVNKTKRWIEKGNGLLRGHSQATQVGVDAGKRFKDLRQGSVQSGGYPGRSHSSLGPLEKVGCQG